MLQLFRRVCSERPGANTKVVPIPGDLCADGLGLSDEHRALVQRECSIVFHVAATLKLEAPLKDALLQNTCATAHVIELVKGMSKLVSFVHLSTAFCHVDELLLEERTYEPLYEPEDMMKSLTWLSVVPAWKEPLQGWVDNLNGPMGLLVGAGKGVIRSMHCKADYHAEVIPVDIAINGMIAAAWRRACDKNKEIQVYNATQGRAEPITWGGVLEKGRRFIYEYPLENAVWYPDGDMRSSRFMHNVCVLFMHILPAIFIDLLLTIFGQKRFMMRIQKRITDGLELLQYFTTREWVFDNDNFEQLKDIMCPEDRAEFNTSFKTVVHEEFLKNCVLGARQYCLKEDLSTLPASRRHIRRLWWVQQIFWFVIYCSLIYYALSYSETAMEVIDRTSSYVKESLRSIPFARLVPFAGSPK
ncbi:hypothetical protein B566_EDAN004100 [Ephemera danica]|nr:hypothetical protein B566_EDAN004100 [Ephemera danica]